MERLFYCCFIIPVEPLLMQMQTKSHLCFSDSWCIYLHATPPPSLFCVHVWHTLVFGCWPHQHCLQWLHVWFVLLVIWKECHLYTMISLTFFVAIYSNSTQPCIRPFFLLFFLSPISDYLNMLFVYVSVRMWNGSSWLLLFRTLFLLEFSSNPTPAFLCYSNYAKFILIHASLRNRLPHA